MFILLSIFGSYVCTLIDYIFESNESISTSVGSHQTISHQPSASKTNAEITRDHPSKLNCQKLRIVFLLFYS